MPARAPPRLQVSSRAGPSSRLQRRIVVFFVVLLMAVQLASFLAIRFAIERTAQDSLREEMRVGSRVFKRLLDQNSQQLVEATSVLTYDFGFREAIASRDSGTTVRFPSSSSMTSFHMGADCGPGETSSGRSRRDRV